MIAPLFLEFKVEYDDVLFLPDSQKAFSVQVTASDAHGVEHSVVAALGDACIDNELLAVPPAHFFPANSLPSTASK